MKCERARRLVEDVIFASEGEASARDDLGITPALEEHLWSCPRCRAAMRELRDLRSQLRALGNRCAPDHLVPRAMRAVRLEWRRRRAAVQRTRAYLRRALVAAAAVAAIAAAGAYLTAHRAPNFAADNSVTANVAPLVMEYADFRGAQPFGDRDGMTLVETQMAEGQRR